MRIVSNNHNLLIRMTEYYFEFILFLIIYDI